MVSQGTWSSTHLSKVCAGKNVDAPDNIELAFIGIVLDDSFFTRLWNASLPSSPTKRWNGTATSRRRNVSMDSSEAPRLLMRSSSRSQ